MTQPRRRVRPLPEFFAALDEQLGDERGPHGEPSRHDFLSLELPRIMEIFATHWDDLPQLIPGRTDYRVLVGPGQLVPAYSVEAQLAPSGVVELTHLALQMPEPGASEDDD